MLNWHTAKGKPFMAIRATRMTAALFLAALFVTAALFTGPTSATASPASTNAANCDGWKIVSAAYVRNRRDPSKIEGAVQLLRNYCHSSGNDYIVWLGRGYAYDTLPNDHLLEVALHSSTGSAKYCGVIGGARPGTYCTTPPLYSDITGNSYHTTVGQHLYAGTQIAYGQTAWI